MVDGYTPFVPKIDFPIEEIFSVHYFEYSSDFRYFGERHDFWEFCYVDKGEVDVMADLKNVHLKKGQMIFHKPNEFHSLRANGTIAPNLVVASFTCNSVGMDMFAGKITTITDAVRALLARMIDEANNAFVTPLGDPGQKQLLRSTSSAIGAEQMVKISLEALLIELARKGAAPEHIGGPTSLIRDKTQQETIGRVLAYLEANVRQKLTLADICRDNLVGRSYLQKLFRERTGGGAMEHFGKIKVEEAKHMIREGHKNFTEISAHLGYNSIHYFSRHFKKVAGMTPSEYASSVKVLVGRSRTDII